MRDNVDDIEDVYYHEMLQNGLADIIWNRYCGTGED